MLFIVCLSCFLFVCLLRFGTSFFSSRHIFPIENINEAAKENLILRYVSKNRKIRLICPFK